jgi:secondary thiamine-phosphate synthase enzyme
MNIETKEFFLNTKGNSDIIDITGIIEDMLSQCNYNEGQSTIFIPGSTAALTTIEYEPGLLKDLPEFLDTILPANKNYYHDLTWHDGNGHAHLRSALIKTSLTVPFKNGKLLLGTWQQILLIDFDNRPRKRKIICQIIGLKK